MEVVLIRHAIAEPRIDEGGTQPDDTLRELTGKGRRRMKQAARGLRELLPGIDVLAASTLIRAEQTAMIVARAYHGLEIVKVPALRPGGGVEAVTGWLRENESSGTIALVGHEPDLGRLAAHLLSGSSEPILTFGKGGAGLFEVPAGVPPGAARLIWLATPRMLRRVG